MRNDQESLARQMRQFSEFQKRLENAAHAVEVDGLTGLASRAMGEAYLAAQLVAGRPTWVILIDLPGLKTINCQWGHACGDRVVDEQPVADKGHEAARHHDVLRPGPGIGPVAGALCPPSPEQCGGHRQSGAHRQQGEPEPVVRGRIDHLVGADDSPAHPEQHRDSGQPVLG